MANIHVNRLGNPNINVGSQSNPNINTGNTTMPKYVGARAEVTRTENGVRIWLKDYKGETEEIIAEAISDIISNEDGSLTFVLPDDREITTDSLEGPQGPQGPQGIQGDQGIQGEDGVGISSITKTGTAGLVDTYTITFTDGTTTTYNVTNGRDGESTGGDVNDVKVDGASVVTGGVAEIDLSGKADISDIPTKVSDLTNDSGFISSETDPTVPNWAKQQNKPSYMFSEIYGTPTTLSEYGITDAYTKSEVDVLVSAVLHFKGTKATVSLLPSSGNKTGDVWHITSDGSEWAWDGSQWQELGTSVDLSGYVPTSRKINGNALTSDITLNIPSKTSDLLNDSGFITSASLPTEVYWADYGSTTYSDLRTAYMANKLIVLIAYRIGLSKYDGSVFTFVGFDSQTRVIRATLDSAGTWNMSWYNTPSKTSDLTNDSGFITSASVPTKTSDLTNDSGFITSASLTEEVFWATYGTTTNAEIDTAINAGKIPMVAVGGRALPLRYAATLFHRFACVDNGTEYTVTCTSDTWGASTQSFVPVGSNGKISASYLPVYDGGVTP